MDARRVLAAAVVVAAFGVQPRAAGDVPRDPRPAIASADLLLRAGASKTILHIPRVGWWTAACGRDRTVGIVFVPDHLLPTADVVVSRSSGAPLAPDLARPPRRAGASAGGRVAALADRAVRVRAGARDVRGCRRARAARGRLGLRLRGVRGCRHRTGPGPDA
jgi:hypothetical protein